jgi:alpha-1,3-fucosyltransferase
MENNIVPVVFNGADMKNFVPPRSVINANDFETVEDLAQYLKYLSNDLNAYQEYFWWKKHYKVITNPYGQGFCNLCKKVNEMSKNRKKQVYENIMEWWYTGTCHERKIKF